MKLPDCNPYVEVAPPKAISAEGFSAFTNPSAGAVLHSSKSSVTLLHRLMEMNSSALEIHNAILRIDILNLIKIGSAIRPGTHRPGKAVSS